eukprot:m.581906 g.581906  ORF g.581906 m.581906 type:complete len:440 (+) comp22334_c1_seq10:146-1465(+)
MTGPISATVHPSVEVPAGLGASDGADVTGEDFKRVITAEETTIPELFAVLRMWEPFIQENLGAVAYELLYKKGAAVDDKDAMTDMNLLHFACKSGARGVGDPEKAANVVHDLIAHGANVNEVCSWTNMAPIHYAAFFGCTPVINVLTTEASPDINARCSEFEGATPLHLSAMAGATDAIAALLRRGADASATDNCGRTALECAKLVAMSPGNATPQATWDDIFTQLQSAEVAQSKNPSTSSTAKTTTKSKRAPLPSTKPAGKTRPPTAKPGTVVKTGAGSSGLPQPSPGGAKGAPPSPAAAAAESNIHVNDRVSVPGGLCGVVRFKGGVSFNKRGTWIGIQLDGPDGKNNGTVEGVQYFRCKLNYGLFVRPSACVVLPQESSSSLSSSGGLSQQRVVWLTCVCVLLCTDVCMCVFCSVLQYIVIMGVCVFVCRRVRVSM